MSVSMEEGDPYRGVYKYLHLSVMSASMEKGDPYRGIYKYLHFCISKYKCPYCIVEYVDMVYDSYGETFNMLKKKWIIG